MDASRPNDPPAQKTRMESLGIEMSQEMSQIPQFWGVVNIQLQRYLYFA